MKNHRASDIVLGAIAGDVVGLVVGTVLNDPAATFWQRLRGQADELDEDQFEVRASSTLPADLDCVVANCTYVAENMTDGQLASAWSSSGSGVGTTISFDFLGTSRTIKQLRIYPGWQDGDYCRLRRNARPSHIELFDERGQALGAADLADPAGGFVSTVVPVDEGVTTLTMRIAAVQAGVPCNDRPADDDTLISEIDVLVVP